MTESYTVTARTSDWAIDIVELKDLTDQEQQMKPKLTKIISDLLISVSKAERQEPKLKVRQDSLRLGNVGVIRTRIVLSKTWEDGQALCLAEIPWNVNASNSNEQHDMEINYAHIAAEEDVANRGVHGSDHIRRSAVFIRIRSDNCGYDPIRRLIGSDKIRSALIKDRIADLCAVSADPIRRSADPHKIIKK
ncbi:Serine/threonine-protein kinase TOUSLED [Arachis hypogaea]|nr:Serine/threonine-protein kinase TOUSLED [Arachis hypogaea]